MKQTLQILLNYLTCQDQVMITKWQNILASFWHKDDGKLVVNTAVQPDEITITLKDGDGNEADLIIPIYEEPQNFTIAKITGLQAALDGKVDKIQGKGLSTHDFTTQLRDKLNALQNYIHPDFHTIGEIDGLQLIIDQLNQTDTDLNNAIIALQNTMTPDVGLRLWNGYRWHKTNGNQNAFPIIGEELQGRGDGRFKNGNWVHCEVTTDDPQDDNDINPFVWYP